MMPIWMAYGVLVGVLLLAAGCALERASVALEWPVRWVWASGLMALLALSSSAPFRGLNTSLPNQEPGAGGTLRLPIPMDAVERRAGPLDLTARVLDLPSAVLERLGTALGPDARVVDLPLGLLLAALSTTLVLLLAVTIIRTRKLRRGWPNADLAGERVRIAPDSGPAVVGVVHPEIVLPRWLLARPAAEIAITVAHEREHVRARDPALLLFGCLAVAMLPWNPAAWWMAARLRLAVELDCDARVVRRGVQRRMYGSVLLRTAQRQRATPLIRAVALTGLPTHLERRLLAMTRTRVSALSRLASVALGVAGLGLVLAACESQLPTAADIAQMDVARAEATAAGSIPVLVLGMTDAAHEIDGVRVSAREARTLAPDEIERIELVRREFGAAAGMVRIRTRAGAEAEAEAGGVRPDELERVERVRRESESAAAMARIAIGGTSGDPLIFIDGQRSSSADLQRLAPESIHRIAVLKADGAVRVHGPEAAAGAIQIYTRR